jgi:membrane fusion protein (multidrug efflux system)
MKNVFFLFAGFISFMYAGCGSDNQAGMEPIDIPVYVTKSENIPFYVDFVGQVYGYQDIAIRARVEGFLEGIHFQEGSYITKGKALYSLESQPFEENVAAKLSQLAEAKTMLAKAESDLNRYRPLAEQNAVSQSDLDAAVAMYEASLASVNAAEANLRAARIQLSYTDIRAPISGIIGKTQAKVGDFVGRSPNPVILNVVSRIDTVLVQFFLSENQYLSVVRAMNRADSEATGPGLTGLQLILSDGTIYPHEGKIDFIDRGLDPTTGAILVQTSFPNPDEIIRPGQYAKVQLEIRSKINSISVPQRCLIELQGQYQIYVVNDSGIVDTRQVKVGPKIKNFWIISDGLEEDEQVVYEGLQKVRNGMTVKPVVKKVELITAQAGN